MSRSTGSDGPPTPSKEFGIDLDTHGFELDPDAPGHIAGTVTRDTHAYLLEFTVDDAYWRIELAVGRIGTVQPVNVYQNGDLVASQADSTADDVSDLPSWLQYVVRHVRQEVF